MKSEQKDLFVWLIEISDKEMSMLWRSMNFYLDSALGDETDDVAYQDDRKLLQVLMTSVESAEMIYENYPNN